MSDSLHVKSGLLLVATFVAGAVFGGWMHAWLAPRPPPPPPPAFQGPPGGIPRWMSQLGLSAEQEEKARALFEKYRPELQQVFEETLPKARAVNERMEEELRQVLTDEQRARLDAWRQAHPHQPGMGPGFGPGFGPGPGRGPGMGPGMRGGMGPPPGRGPPPAEAPPAE